MSKLEQWMWKACSALGLHVDLKFRLVLPSGRELVTVARVANLGAQNGMLLFRTDNEIRDYSQELLNAGYGYSVVDEPYSGEQFDLASFQEMFRDWGWSGALGSKPDWMR